MKLISANIKNMHINTSDAILSKHDIKEIIDIASFARSIIWEKLYHVLNAFFKI